KTHRFVALLGELFSAASAVTEFVSGIENVVRINLGEKTKRGRIDAYHGNALIEFEKSLRATEEHAKQQLRENRSGTRAREGTKRLRLVCIGYDGIFWKVFAPRLRAKASCDPEPDDVELEAIRTIVVSEATLGDFWIWLTGLLFRDSRTYPSA